LILSEVLRGKVKLVGDFFKLTYRANFLQLTLDLFLRIWTHQQLVNL